MATATQYNSNTQEHEANQSKKNFDAYFSQQQPHVPADNETMASNHPADWQNNMFPSAFPIDQQQTAYASPYSSSSPASPDVLAPVDNNNVHNNTSPSNGVTPMPPLDPMSRMNNHLRIYAIPYQGNKLYFLPQWIHEEPGKVQRFQDKQRFKSLKAKPKSIRGRMWAHHEKSVAKESPATKFVKRLPKHANSIEIVYPSSVSKEAVIREMQSEVSKKASSKKWATIGFGIALPFCIVIDIFTIGFLLTLGDVIMLTSSYKAWTGTKDVQKVLNHQNTQVEFTQNDFLANFGQKSTGLLSEDDMTQLREFTGEKGVCKTVRKLRDREQARNN